MGDADEPLIDVPDNFDLQEMRHKRSTTDPDDMPACPECGSHTWIPKSTHSKHDTGDRGRYRCTRCGTHFDGGDR